MLCAVTGFQMFRVAQSWLVYELTGSPLYLGYALAANAIPGIFFNLVGGVFADRLNKRILVFCTQGSTGLFILVLGLLTLFGVVEVWHIMAIAFLARRGGSLRHAGAAGPLSASDRTLCHDQRRRP